MMEWLQGIKDAFPKLGKFAEIALWVQRRRNLGKEAGLAAT